MTVQTFTITTETIKQYNEGTTKRGRPRKGEPHKKPREVRGFTISDEAHAAIHAAAQTLGVTASALVEALGRTLAEQEQKAA